MTTLVASERLIEQALIKERQGEHRGALLLLRRAALDPVVRADAFFHEARILKDRDLDYARALDLFGRSAAEQSDAWKRSESLLEKGEVLTLLGRPDEAIEALEEARGQLPVRTKEPRAAIYDAMSRAHEAAGRLRQALTCHRLAYAHYRSGAGGTVADHDVRTVRLSEKLGDFDRLVTCLGRLLERDPDRIPVERGVTEAQDPPTQARLARLLAGLGGVLSRADVPRDDPPAEPRAPQGAPVAVPPPAPDGAPRDAPVATTPPAPRTQVARHAMLFRGIVFFLLGRDREATQCATSVLEGGDHFFAHHLLGKIALRHHRYPQAREHLDRSAGVREPYPGLLEDLATACRRMSAFDKAIEVLDRLSRFERKGIDRGAILLQIAELHEARGDRLAAYRVMRKVADEDLADVRRDRLGAMGCALERYEEAIRDLTLAIAARPDEAVYILRGRALEAEGFPRRALADYGRALKLVGDRKDIFWREATMRRANILIRHLGRHQEGLDLIAPLLDKDPDGEEVLLLKGDGLKGLHRYSESVACYADAVDRRIGSSLLDEGRKLLDDGKVDEALRCYNQAFAKRPSWEVYYAAAAAYARLGRPQEACRYVERAAAENRSAVRFARRDKDFEGIREHPAFKALLDGEEAGE